MTRPAIIERLERAELRAEGITLTWGEVHALLLYLTEAEETACTRACIYEGLYE